MNLIDNTNNNAFSKENTDIIHQKNSNRNSLTIETEFSSMKLSYRLLIIIFIAISPLLLVLFYLGFIYTSIFLLTSYLLVLSIFMYRYFFFRNRMICYKFDRSQQKVLFQRVSNKIKLLEELDFSSIKTIKCYKKRNFLDIPGFNQHIVVLITSKGKRYRIYFGKLDNCERILGAIKNYLDL